MSDAGASPTTHTLRAVLDSQPIALRAEALLAELCHRAGQRLNQPGPIAADASWSALGFDSLRAAEFRDDLARDLALELRPTLLFDHATPRQLAQHLLSLLPDTSLAEVAAPPRAGGEPIAIVGAACRLPGSPDLDAFWQLLVEGRCAVGPIPRERFDVDAYYDADPAAAGGIYVRDAGIVPDLEQFDADLFRISPRDAIPLDPQQRLLLETAWHALEHANLTPRWLKDQRVGVYIGTRASEYVDARGDRSPAAADAWHATGNALSTAASRISCMFGFNGPCLPIDTACSGSLVAVHVAVRALRSRECDVAMVGGANAILDPVMMAGLCRARMLASDGRSKAFDAAADGYGRGEGAAMVVLKRLTDAVAAGDRVLALVLGSDINQDGRSAGLTVPNGPAQAAVIRGALADAGVAPSAVDYVEAHGTGTELGDPIEVGALNEVFRGRTRPLPIGSVKTNVGHLEPAAGIVSLLKVVLALRAGIVPATLHQRRPNPHIDWQRSVVRVVAAQEPWPSPSSQRLAGVSSFGFSGTNCHVIIAAAPPAPAPADAVDPGAGPWLLPLQAASPLALRDLARRHAEALAGATNAVLAQSCHAASVGRGELPWRAAFLADEPASLQRSLLAFAEGDARAAMASGHAPRRAPLALLFPGQGAQRAGMGSELFHHEPAFRAALQAADKQLQGQLPTPLLDLMFGDRAGALDRTDATQPTLCAYQLALLATLRGFSVDIDAVLGHSIGDYAAAVAAGVLTQESALMLAAACGRLMVERCRPGGMLAVLADPSRWRDQLAAHPNLRIAVRNADANLVVAGESWDLALLQRELESVGIATRHLNTSHAFHTPAMQPALAPFAALLHSVVLRPPVHQFVDGRAARVAGAELADPAFWCAHLREPVDFAAGLRTLQTLHCRVWLEMGAAPTLTPLATAAANQDVVVIPLQRSGRLGRRGLLSALGEAWAHGAAMDLGALNHFVGKPTATVPAYPFQRQRYWLDRSVSSAHPGAGHPLLGTSRSSSLLAPGQRLFSANLSDQQPAWLRDHTVFGSVLLPVAATVEAAAAAAMATGAALPLALGELAWHVPLRLHAQPLALEWLHSDDGAGARFEWRAQGSDGSWRTHATGRVGPLTEPTPPPLALSAIAARCRGIRDGAEFYSNCSDRHLDCGPSFRTVTNLRLGDGEALAELQLPANLPLVPFLLHPALLDGCWSATLSLGNADGPMLPAGVDAIHVYAPLPRALHCHTIARHLDREQFVGDCVITDSQGQVLASVRGLRARLADGSMLREGSVRHLMYHASWEPWQPGVPLLPRRRTAVVGGGPLAVALVAQLPAGSAKAVEVSELATVVASTELDAVVVLATDFAEGRPESILKQAFALTLAVLPPLLAAARPLRPWLVTYGSQRPLALPPGPIPLTASLWGLWRTLALERPDLLPVTVDLDAVAPLTAVTTHAESLAKLLGCVQAEGEVAIGCGQWFVRRLRPGANPSDSLAVPKAPLRVRVAERPNHGPVATTLLRRTPGAGEVEVALQAVGLNFKDVLHVRRLLASDSEPLLGIEGVGTVTAAGPGVALAPGTVVAVLAAGALASHITVAQERVLPLPAGLPPLQMAGAPVAFVTVLHGVFGLARVRAGETVLVHSAAGGIGQAAVAVLRAAGCRVLATCSEAKRALVAALGATVVGNTRTLDFVRGAMTATSGRGVDVVLDTLHGDALPQSLAALAIGGRLVELSKLGVWSREQVAAVRPDVAYFPFELADDGDRNDAEVQARLTEMGVGLAAGRWPLPATTIVPLAALTAACQQMAQGLHIGKIVVRMPSTIAGDRSEGTWLLTGGSGGLAPSICRALMDAGVRHLALLARRAIDPTVLAELRVRGAEVQWLAADVTDRRQLAQALDRVRATMLPIRGIVHAAGCLADATLNDLTLADAMRALAPKVVGACLLDELTMNDPVAQFVLLGSMAGTLGSAGQGAYAAANAFLEAFASWRRAQGRAAVTMAFGPWAGDGMVGRLPERLRSRLQRLGITALPAAAAARLLVQTAAAEHDCAVLPVRWPDWFAAHGDKAPAALQHMRLSTPHRPHQPRPRPLAGVPAGERASVLRRELRIRLAEVLGFATADELPIGVTFRDLGLDSLLALDAKERIEQLVGLSLPPTLLFDQPNLEQLVNALDERLAATTR